MTGLKRSLDGFRRKVFSRKNPLTAGGIPYALGQGLDSPFIEPALTVHWHPPFSVTAAQEHGVKKSRIHHLFEKLGFKRKSA